MPERYDDGSGSIRRPTRRRQGPAPTRGVSERLYKPPSPAPHEYDENMGDLPLLGPDTGSLWDYYVLSEPMEGTLAENVNKHEFRDLDRVPIE